MTIENLKNPFISVRTMAKDIILHSTDLLTIDPSVVSGLLNQNLEKFQSHRTENLLSTPWLSWECELSLCLFFNSVNFCYREPSSGKEYRYITRDGRPLKRTAAFFTALSESGLDWNDLNQVAALSPASWLELTQLDKNNTLYIGLERRERIVGLANFLIRMGIETVLGFIEVNNFDSLKITQVLIESGFFKDEFLKRAQVALKMMNTVSTIRDGRELNGIDQLTCMADYRIPQVFYNLDAVKLSPDLEGQLTRLEPVLSDSRAELALRATVIVIGTQLAELMGINEAEVDTLLWEYSQQMDKTGQMKIPHMVVATDKY
jgi:hypothetical protein